MPFELNEVGGAPSIDEFEVTVFGPGFGECILLHVGAGRWVIVDSCIDASDSTGEIPIAEKYLRHLAVDMQRDVDLIVATHWHDDHVKGLSRLVDICRGAKFCCANALTKAEFAIFVHQMSTGALATDGAKVKEFKRILDLLAARGTSVRYASGSKTLMSWPIGEPDQARSCEIRSLSPSDKEYALFLEMVGAQMPTANAPKRSAANQNPNLSSIVLHVSMPDAAVLLGADMEIHHDPARGWNSVLSEAQTSRSSLASVYKVAHHGSSNGHHEQIWTQLLHRMPICVTTPFNRLPDDRKLPTDADINRMLQLGRLVLTAPRTAKKPRTRDPAVVRSLKESAIVTKELSSPLGMVRLRRRMNSEDAWRMEILAPAEELSPA